MNKKKRVGILFGGKSAEHEVSLQSAKNVFDTIDRRKYDPVLIAIDKKGKWLMCDEPEFVLNADDPKKISLNENSVRVAMIPQSEGEVNDLLKQDIKDKVDVVFPILHGPFGEDGTVQGLLKLVDIPFVGAGVLGSAVGMDKDIMKRLFIEASVPIGKYLCFKKGNVFSFDKVKKDLGLPLFVKPANLGSSVGVNKVRNEDEYQRAIQEAFLYDTKIVVEENIRGREIECAVLGNNNPISSVVGEIIVNHDFYSYEAKYIDESGATLKIPADISKEKQAEVKALSIKVFQVLCCEGLGRVDMFLKDNGELFVSEINTIPGFTKNSMYPKLWEASGIEYSDLIDKLILLAIERHNIEKQLKIEVSL